MPKASARLAIPLTLSCTAGSFKTSQLRTAASLALVWTSCGTSSCLQGHSELVAWQGGHRLTQATQIWKATHGGTPTAATPEAPAASWKWPDMRFVCLLINGHCFLEHSYVYRKTGQGGQFPYTPFAPAQSGPTINTPHRGVYLVQLMSQYWYIINN